MVGSAAALELQDAASNPTTKWTLGLQGGDLRLAPGPTPDTAKETWFRADGSMELDQGVSGVTQVMGGSRFPQLAGSVCPSSSTTLPHVVQLKVPGTQGLTITRLLGGPHDYTFKVGDGTSGTLLSALHVVKSTGALAAGANTWSRRLQQDEEGPLLTIGSNGTVSLRDVGVWVHGCMGALISHVPCFACVFQQP